MGDLFERWIWCGRFADGSVDKLRIRVKSGHKPKLWFGAAEAADAEEDKLHGRDQTGEEMPDWVADKKRRAEKIRNAKAELEAEAEAATETKLKAEAEAAEKREADPQPARQQVDAFSDRRGSRLRHVFRGPAAPSVRDRRQQNRAPS